MSFTTYSHSLRHKEQELSKLNYYTFSDEFTPLDMNFPSSRWQRMLCTKIEHSRRKTQLRIRFNTVSVTTYYIEELKSRSVETAGASRPNRLAEVSQKESGSPITSIHIF
jgi:hypothetical protein